MYVKMQLVFLIKPEMGFLGAWEPSLQTGELRCYSVSRTN